MVGVPATRLEAHGVVINAHTNKVVVNVGYPFEDSNRANFAVVFKGHNTGVGDPSEFHPTCFFELVVGDLLAFGKIVYFQFIVIGGRVVDVNRDWCRRRRVG